MTRESRKANAARPPSHSVEGTIAANEVYTLEEFARRMGWSDPLIRKAQHAGLKTTKIGIRKYVKGTDAIAFLDAYTKQ